MESTSSLDLRFHMETSQDHPRLSPLIKDYAHKATQYFSLPIRRSYQWSGPLHLLVIANDQRGICMSLIPNGWGRDC